MTGDWLLVTSYGRKQQEQPLVALVVLMLCAILFVVSGQSLVVSNQ